MKSLIEHFIRENTKTIIEKSLMNCHCKGIHSIVFNQDQERTIRMFVAMPGHEMTPFQIGFHPHHCNITLSVVRGQLNNWLLLDEPGETMMSKWTYVSPIKNNEGGFELVKEMDVVTLQNVVPLLPGESCWMDAKQIHSVSADPNELTAWFVFEGKEDESL